MKKLTRLLKLCSPFFGGIASDGCFFLFFYVFWGFDIGHGVIDIGHWVFDIGHGVIDIGRGVIDIGHGVSDIGHGVIDIGK